MGAFGYRVPPAAPPLELVPVDSSIPVATEASTTTLAITEPPDLVEQDDRFRIASISKMITATVVLQIVEAGQLPLDEPVGDALAAHLGVTIADGDVPDGHGAPVAVAHVRLPDVPGHVLRRAVDSCPAAAAEGLGRGLRALPGTRTTTAT